MKVLFFGKLKDIGKDFIEINFSGKVKYLKEEIFKIFPEIQKEYFKVAVNGEIVDDEKVIGGEDEVALLPPFSGG